MSNVWKAIPILVVAIAAVVWIVSYIQTRRGEISDSNFERIQNWARVAVEAAEQLFGSGTGEKKKAYVIEFLEGVGFPVTPQVDTVIEAMVSELNMKLADKEK